MDNEANPRRNGPTGNELGRAVTRSAWPTATAMDSIGSGSAGYGKISGKGNPRRVGTTLTDAANCLWARPQARDWKDSGPTQGNRKSPNLGTQAHFPSPKASDGRSKGTGGTPDHGLDAMARAGLLDQGSHSTSGKNRDWPTVQAHDQAPGDPARIGRHGTKHGDRNLNDWVGRGVLNSRWVCQLMNYDADWLDVWW